MVTAATKLPCNRSRSTPPNPTIAANTTQGFTAIGTRSDNSTVDLTSQVTWDSATLSVATITTTGLATGVSAGTSMISASMNGITARRLAHRQPPRRLQSIAIDPTNPSIPADTTQQFTAIGTLLR